MIGTLTEIKPGDIVAGRYRVEGLLSQGGMGVVLAARHTMLDERVALKLLRPELASDPDAVRRFLREAKAAARIRSEHAVRVLDVGRIENGSPYIAMELLEGSDLASVLQREGPMPAARAVDCVLQACEALAEAHAIGIVHRDLKPANLFLTRTPGRPVLVKVLDFGISKIPTHDDPGLTASIMGTPRYMSPEQMRSTRSVDARADIWSLGVILYELLSGHTPFDADTAPLLCSKVLTEPPRPITLCCPELPSELAAIVMRCLDKTPDLRFARIDALVDALAPFGSEQGRISQKRVALTMAGEPPASSPPETTRTTEQASQRTLGPEELSATAAAPAHDPTTPAGQPSMTPPSRPSAAPPDQPAMGPPSSVGPPSGAPSSASLPVVPVHAPSPTRLLLGGLALTLAAMVGLVALRPSPSSDAASSTSAAPATAAASKPAAPTAATAAASAAASVAVATSASAAASAQVPPARTGDGRPRTAPAPAPAPRGKPTANGDLYGDRK